MKWKIIIPMVVAIIVITSVGLSNMYHQKGKTISSNSFAPSTSYISRNSSIQKSSTGLITGTHVYSHTYTKIVHVTSSTLYETYVATYTRPATYSIFSLLLIASSRIGSCKYEFWMNMLYDEKGGLVKYHQEYAFPTVASVPSPVGTSLTTITRNVCNDVFMDATVERTGNNYTGYIFGWNGSKTYAWGPMASRMYSKYVSTITSVYSEFNFAPVMTLTVGGVPFVVTIPPTFYSTLYTAGTGAFTEYMVLPSSITPMSNITMAPGTYTLLFIFKVYGEKPEVITTTITRTLVTSG